jgi:hypothetical protein
MAGKRRKQGLVVKASIVIGVREHAIWSACAALSKMDRSAFAVRAIKDACSGLGLVDRRKVAGQAKMADLPGLDPDADDAA